MMAANTDGDTRLGFRLREIFDAQPPKQQDEVTGEIFRWGLSSVLADAYLFSRNPEKRGARLSAEDAFEIWRIRYVTEPRLDLVAAQNAPLAIAMLDAEVSLGIPEAATALRHALMALGFPLDPAGGIDCMVMHALRDTMSAGNPDAGGILSGLIRAETALSLLPKLIASGSPEEQLAAWWRALRFGAAPA